MKKEEAYQIQRGDYFLFQGEVVKVCSKDFCLEGFRVKTKNGKSKYADIEELEPIVLNEYVLKQVGAIPHEHNEAYDIEDFILYFHHGELFLIEHISTDIQITMDITYFHVLQNALRLFGVEVELKQ